MYAVIWKNINVLGIWCSDSCVAGDWSLLGCYAFSLKLYLSMFTTLELLEPEDEGMIILRNVGFYNSNDTAW